MSTHFTKKNLLVSLSVLVILVLPQISHAQVADAVGGAIQSLLYNFVVVVFGMLVRFGGMLLDAGIEYFVIGFGDVFNNSGVGLAVNDTWVIIRDFINLFFIFGLVYIGIRMILDSDNSNTRRWLVNLIMAALLVNFSLFATKFVVDFSNKLATEIADAGLGADKDPKTGAYTANVSGELMLRMGITTALGGETTAMPANAGWGYIFGIAILFMVSAFVFAAGGILLIIRFAVICLYLVLSPVMFASWVLPGLSDTMNRYWKDFIKRCFVAPIYLTFIYFSFQIMGGLQQTIKGSGEGANATNFANPNWSATLGASSPNTVQDSTLGTLPFFVLICIFMIASLVAANKLGAEGAGKALSIGKKLNNKIQSGVKNTTKFAAAQTGGRAARYASDKTGQAVGRGLRNLQQLEGTGRFAKATRALARTNAIQGTVGGAADSLQKTKFGLSRTRAEDAKMQNQTNKNADNGMTLTDGLLAQKEKELKAQGKGYVVRDNGTREEVLESELTPEEQLDYNNEEAREARIAKMERVAADMGIKDFEAMSKAEQQQISQFISGGLTESVMKSDNISDEQKGKIGEAQKAAIEKIITQNGELMSDKIADLSTRQIETLGSEWIKTNAGLLTESQFADIKKSKKFTETQVGGLIGARKADLTARVASNPDSVFKLGTSTIGTTDLATRQTTYRTDYSKSRKAADIAKLPGEVLASQNAASYLTVDTLKAIANGGQGF